MLPLETLGRVTTPDGKELVLYHRDGAFHIRVDGLELMSSRAHGSEDALAELACGPLRNRHGGGQRPPPRILVGGLGMGFTLRAALEQLPRRAVVEVAEVFAAVVEWNRGPLAHLARRPLDDSRVRVVVSDFGAYLDATEASYDVILLDVDNGPDAFTLESNAGLYTAVGLVAIRRRLAKKGVLGVWSADPSRRFEKELSRCGFSVRSEKVAARRPEHGGARRRRDGRGPLHTIFLARPRQGRA